MYLFPWPLIFSTMKYTIEMEFENGEAKGGISIELNTADGGDVTLCSYGTTMNFSQFIEFADSIHEIRQKFAVINAKHEESNGRTN